MYLIYVCVYGQEHTYKKGENERKTIKKKKKMNFANVC